MASVEDREDAVKALHRMIVYVRNEAARLRIADAALLLGYAEDAIMTRDAAQCEESARDARTRGSIVQH